MAGRAEGFRLDRREFLLGFPLFFWRRPKAKIADAEFRAVRRGQARRHYIWIHGNEETAKVVLSEHMRVREGRAFFTTSHIRNVRISDGVIDPNRMFSRDGAERNLRTLNPRWTDGQLTHALSRLDKDREKFLKQILPENGRVLVALHNNSSAYSALGNLAEQVRMLNWVESALPG
jgi:hypothetical protein